MFYCCCFLFNMMWVITHTIFYVVGSWVSSDPWDLGHPGYPRSGPDLDPFQIPDIRNPSISGVS